MDRRGKYFGRGAVCAATLCVAALWGATESGAQPDAAPRAPAALEPTGLPDGESPEAVLPGGAVIHVRLHSAQSLLDDVSVMAEKFVPPSALPPPLRQALGQPNALLALVGIQTMGQPLTIDGLAKLSGIDPGRPVTLSCYLGPPPESFILLVPVRDLTALSGMLARLAGPRPVEKIALEGGSAFHLRDRDLNLFIVCSEKTVCVCGSRQLATQLLSAPRQQRLDRSELVARVLKEHPQDNLLVVADAAPLKPLLPMLQQFAALPERAVEQTRRRLLSGYSPRDLAAANSQLRRRLGVRDVNQLLDYVECLLTGTYEVLAENLLKQAAAFEGASLAVDLSGNFQRVHVSVYSGAITAAAANRPLPLAEVGRAIAKVPGSHNSLLLDGQSPPATKSHLLGEILQRIGVKMKGKELPPGVFEMLSRAYADYQPAQELESKVPWTITTRVALPGYKSPAGHASLQAYLEHLREAWGSTQIVAIPRQPQGFLEAVIRQRAQASNVNDRVYRRLLETSGLGAPFYTRESRASSQPLAGGVTRLVEENSYMTRGGLFGYNEHELINRRFTLARDAGELTLLSQGGTDPAVLTQYESQPIPAAVKRLLAEMHVPADANHVEVLRVLQSVHVLADTLSEIEALVHKDAADYLAQVEAIRGRGGSKEQILAQLAELKMPAEVFELKMGGNGDFYVTTPVGLALPRPRVMPDVTALLADYRKVSDSQGGAAAWQRTRDGQFEVMFVQSTEALATLVRTVGDQIVRRYLQDPEGMARLRGLTRTPLDKESRRHATLTVNTTWEFLPRSGPAQPLPEE